MGFIKSCGIKLITFDLECFVSQKYIKEFQKKAKFLTTSKTKMLEEINDGLLIVSIVI